MIVIEPPACPMRIGRRTEPDCTPRGGLDRSFGHGWRAAVPAVAALAIGGWPAGPAAAADQPVVAVFEIENAAELPADLVSGLTDYLRVKLSETRAVRVVDKGEQQAQLRRLIEEQKQASYQACYEEACQIPLGKELAADRILRGSIARFGDQYVLSIELIDLVTGTSAAAASDKSAAGGQEELLASVERVVASLMGGGRPAAPNVAEGGPSGRLTVTSDPPGLDIYVDGVATSLRSPNVVHVAPGKHVVSVRRGPAEATAEVSIEAGAPASVQLDLPDAKVAAMAVSTKPPGARVVVDGVEAGEAPVLLEGQAPGKHELEASMPGYRGSREVDLGGGETQQILLELDYESGYELYGSAIVSLLGLVFDGEAVDWTAGLIAGARIRESGPWWLDCSAGVLNVRESSDDSRLTGDTSSVRTLSARQAARIEVSQWFRFPLKTGDQSQWLPSDRIAFGLGAGAFAVLPGGVGGLVAGQLDLWWLTGRLAFTLDSMSGGPGIELTGGLRFDLPVY